MNRFIEALLDAPLKQEGEEPLTTTWLNPYCPYKCEHCGHYSDSKTPYCAWCGRKAANYND